MGLLTPRSAYSAMMWLRSWQRIRPMDGASDFVAELVIDDAQVEVHLAGVFGLELPFLQVDHDEAAQLQVVEQEVDVEVAVADFQVKLPADEGEALAEFQQEALKLVKEIRLQFPLVERLFQGEEVEDIRVLERLPGEVGLRSRQALLEVGDGLSLPAMGLRLDHGEQDVAAPAVGKRLLHVPEAGSTVFDLLHQEDVMEPGMDQRIDSGNCAAACGTFGVRAIGRRPARVAQLCSGCCTMRRRPGIAGELHHRA